MSENLLLIAEHIKSRLNDIIKGAREALETIKRELEIIENISLHPEELNEILEFGEKCLIVVFLKTMCLCIRDENVNVYGFFKEELNHIKNEITEYGEMKIKKFREKAEELKHIAERLPRIDEELEDIKKKVKIVIDTLKVLRAQEIDSEKLREFKELVNGLSEMIKTDEFFETILKEAMKIHEKVAEIHEILRERKIPGKKLDRMIRLGPYILEALSEIKAAQKRLEAIPSTTCPKCGSDDVKCIGDFLIKGGGGSGAALYECQKCGYRFRLSH